MVLPFYKSLEFTFYDQRLMDRSEVTFVWFFRHIQVYYITYLFPDPSTCGVGTNITSGHPVRL